MTFDLYAWKAPRELEPKAAASLVGTWEEGGAEPSEAPFEPSDDVGWFYRELLKDGIPGLEALSDGVPDHSSRPIWLSTDPPAPARIVAMRFPSSVERDDLDGVYGLAAKYDLVLFEPRGPSLHLPLEVMAEQATATFWPSGAIQAFVAGSVGVAIVVISWIVGIPILSWVGILIGAFMALGAVYTFVHEGRRLRDRRREAGSDGGARPG